MSKRSLLAVIAIGAAAIGSCERRATAPTPTSGEACTTEPPAKLRAVLHYLHRMHEAEIRSGNLAADRTLESDVRRLAVRMVAEHMTADQKLTDLARRERIDLDTQVPADPVHAAALRLAAADQEEMQELSNEALDVVYVTSEAEKQALLLEVVDQGEKFAEGDVKSLLDEAHDMAARHHDGAVMLMQDLRFVPRAVGGGPPEKSGDAASSRNRSRRPSKSIPLSDSPRLDDPMHLDAGTWPPVTAPPERIP